MGMDPPCYWFQVPPYISTTMPLAPAQQAAPRTCRQPLRSWVNVWVTRGRSLLQLGRSHPLMMHLHEYQHQQQWQQQQQE